MGHSTCGFYSFGLVKRYFEHTRQQFSVNCILSDFYLNSYKCFLPVYVRTHH